MIRRFIRWIGRILATVIVVGVAAFFLFAPGIVERAQNPVLDHAPYPVSDRARALHDRIFIADWHSDTLLWDRDLLARGKRGHVDIPRLAEGNVALQGFAAATRAPWESGDRRPGTAIDRFTLLFPGQLWPLRTWFSLPERALYMAERLHDAAARSQERFTVITSRAELDELVAARAAGDKVIGGLLTIEGMHAIAGDIAHFDRLEAAGYRVIGLHHFFDNLLGGSLNGMSGGGLTEFGRQVVAEVEARGMVLDLAHSSPAVVRDVLAITDMPVLVSHTGLHSHCQNHRNIADDLMLQVAARGGVVGMGYWATVTCDDSPYGVAHSIAAAVRVLGEDHVSLGSDFDGSVMTSFDASELAGLTEALLLAGLTDGQIEKVMGQNMLRVLRARLK